MIFIYLFIYIHQPNYNQLYVCTKNIYHNNYFFLLSTKIIMISDIIFIKLFFFFVLRHISLYFLNILL